MHARELQKLSRLATEGVKAIRELKAAREQHVEAIRQIDAAMGNERINTTVFPTSSTKQESSSTATKEPAKKAQKQVVSMPKIPKAPAAKQAKPTGAGGKRVLSEEARERIREAQRKRWAKQKGTKPAKGKPKAKAASASDDEPERGAVPMFALEDAI